MKTDILVVGDGPSAVAAAIAASRMGVRTTLATDGSARPTGGGLHKREAFEWRGSAFSGIWEEVKRRAGEGPCDSRALSDALNEMLAEAKVNIVGKSMAGVSRTDGGAIEDVLVTALKKRSMRIEAKVYIDSTGTAELALEAGAAEKDELRPGDQTLVGLEIHIQTAHDWPGDMRFDSQEPLTGRLQAQMDETGVDFQIDSVLLRKRKDSRITACVTGWAKYSMFGWEDGERAGRLAVQWLLEQIPALDGAGWTHTYCYKGPGRVSQCRGEYRLTEEDICEGRAFEDWVVSGARCGFDSEMLGEAIMETPGYDGREYTIPLRSLLAEGCDNLILNGRGICASDMARRSISSAPIAFALGEAAGTAAALAVKKKCAPKELTAGEIQRELMKRGVKGPEKCKE